MGTSKNMSFNVGHLHGEKKSQPTSESQMRSPWDREYLPTFPLRIHHQEFQVPKMEVLSLIRLFWGWIFPYISLTYCLYR